MALNRRERTLLVATVTALLVAANYLLAGPLLRSWSRLSADLHTQRLTLDGYRTNIARTPELQAEYDKLRQQVGERITQFEEISDVLKRIEEVGGSSGAQITQRKPLPESDRGAYRELPVQCRMDATIESLVKFLFGLRTSGGFVQVEQLQIQPQANNPSVLRCDVLIHALAAKTKSGDS